MKRFILTEQQLEEYVQIKKDERIFFDVVFDLYNNKKYLKEEVSLDSANSSIISKYKNKKLLNQKINEMLLKYNLINNTEII